MNYELRIKNFFAKGEKTRNPKPSTLNAQKGFSLIEVLVATTVLVIAVTGTLSIIARNVSSAGIAQERVTAFYLAQEALEFVRSVRDNNAIAPDHGWLDGFGGGFGDEDDCFATNGCMVDVNQPAELIGDEWDAPGDKQIVQCPLSGCDPLFFGGGVYNQQGEGSGNTVTAFVREVKITETTLDREVRVDVTVRWLRGYAEESFTISGHLFNWR